MTDRSRRTPQKERERFDLDREASARLAEWDPARHAALRPSDVETMRRRVLDAAPPGETGTRRARLALAAAAALLAMTVGLALWQSPGRLSRESTPMVKSAPASPAERDAPPALQVQLTGASGTRIYWTIERRRDG